MIVAIDPGKSGGIAVYEPTEVMPIMVYPLKEEAFAEFVEALPTSASIYVERQQGTGRMTDFEFGRHYGALLTTLHSMGFVPELVAPQKWQHPLNPPRGVSYDARKTWLRDEAVRLASEVSVDGKITAKTCDAFLILDYAMEQETNAVES